MAQAWRQFLEPVASADHEPRSHAKHPGLTWHDHLVMLLQVAAEIEHGLMVQYLYAAYSLGGPDVAASAKRRVLVNEWQASLLKVAKEEMGHLLTVQNILCLIGAQVHFGREDYPWTVPYYPFPFRLEKLTRSSLACYVHAEMPPHIGHMLKKYPRLSPRFKEFAEKDKAEIDRLVKESAKGEIHYVATIYDEIIRVIGDKTLIPDAAFNEGSYVHQASWDDWGRNYGPEMRGLDPGGSLAEAAKPQHEANLLIARAATRTEAIAALTAIGSQGEAVHLQSRRTDELSHFERFLKIFQQFPADWVPARDIPNNPTTRKFVRAGATYIENDQARAWGTLFNYRYRLLLMCLAHSFRLQRLVRAGEPNLRGMVMHRVFGEMYNIKTIAGIIVGLELRKKGSGKGQHFAGPPFEMPFSLTLPDSQADAWRLHQEVLQGASDVVELLLKNPARIGRDYLIALRELDRRAIVSIEALLDGQGSKRT